MAQRRMFSMQVIDTDQFLDMPPSSQCLYFHLGMRADDDGFVASPRKIMKITNSSDDDYKLLLAKQFVIPFASGICVIRHWRIHNYIQSDRYHETIYKDERRQLAISNNHYETLDTECIQDVSKVDTEVRLGKVSRGKERKSAPKKIKHETLGVPMNETRYRNLCEQHGTDDVERYLQKVADWASTYGKSVKDYAAAAGNWMARDIEEGKLRLKKDGMSDEEFESWLERV